VRSPVPFGPAPFAVDPAEWDGTWCAADGLRISRTAPASVRDESACAAITVVDPVHGVLDLSVPTDSAGPDVERVHLRAASGPHAEAFVWQESNGSFEFVGRVRREDRVLTFWSVRAAGFVEDVTGGRLPGRTEEASAVLDAVDQDAVGRIDRDESGSYFDWRSPLTLVRVTEQ